MTPPMPPKPPTVLPPRVERNSPPRQPLVAPQRARQASHDDLAAVAGAEAQEQALRAAASELERERAAGRAAEVRAAQAEAERDRLSVTAAATPESDAPDSKSLRVSWRGLKLAIPGAVVAPIVAAIIATGQHFVALRDEMSAVRVAFKAQEARFAALEASAASRTSEANELRETAARLSGYLEATLRLAGVNVKAEAGATAVVVKSDPLPPSAARRPQVTVTTPVPAPAPRSR